MMRARPDPKCRRTRWLRATADALAAAGIVTALVLNALAMGWPDHWI